MNYYNSIAAGYKELHEEEQLKKLFLIKNNVELDANTTVLDLGCGNGISSDLDCYVVGVDPSMELLKQNPNKAKLLGIAEHIPLKDNSFDCVISITAIHNFNNIRKSIREIKRVCKNKCILSILTKSRKFNYIRYLIEQNFAVEKIIEEDKDVIFFCARNIV